MSTTSELVERLQNVSEWKKIIERHRRITDDPRISYVLQDGTRVHEDESVVAKLAASLSRALEDAADTASAAAARLDELERENAVLRGALEPFVSQHAKWSERLPDTQRFAVMCLSSPADGDIVMDADITMADFRRAALAGSGEP